jgi:outer membrane protein
MRTLLLLSLLTASLLASDKKPLSVDDLIAIAIENSPDLNISRANVEAARQNTRVSRSYYLPQLGLTALAGAGGAGVESNTSDGQTVDSGSLLSGTITASQLIYDFGKTGGGIRAASYQADASDFALKQAIENKIYDVKKAYYDVLRTRSLIGVNRENVKLNEQQLHRAKRYFETGIRTKIDVTDARVNLINAQLKLQDAQYDLRRARIVLEKVVGIAQSQEGYTLRTMDLNTTDLYATLPDVSQPLETIETYAYAHRQELKQYSAIVESSKAAVTKARGDYYPSIGLQGTYTRNVAERELQIYYPNQLWGVGIGLSWNLFSGFHTDASVEYAKAELMRSRAAMADEKLRIRQQVADANTVTLKRRDGVKLSQSLVEAAKERFTQAQKRYEYGLSDYIELQQARQGYIDASANLIVQYYNFFNALAKRDRAMGK